MEMKRKEYQKPAMQVVKLLPINILAGSHKRSANGETFNWDEDDD
jgi:hypothetical protein